MNILKLAVNKDYKWVNIIFGCTAIGVIIAASFLTFSQHPIAKPISLWQSDLIDDKGKFYPALTIFLLALPPLLVLLLVKIVVIKFISSRKEK